MGITAHAINAKVNVSIGEKTKINLLDFSGKIVSFVNNLIPSAKG